jgi:hypothetical protein
MRPRTLIRLVSTCVVTLVALACGEGETPPADPPPSPPVPQVAPDQPEARAPTPLTSEEVGLRVVVVRTDTGAPFAGAECVVLDSERVEHRGTTGKDGAFDARLPSTWGAEATVRAPGFVAAWSRANDLVAGEWTDVALELQPGRTLTGRVTDAGSGTAIAGATLRIPSPEEDLLAMSRLGPPPLAETTSGADGTFSLGPAPLGEELAIQVQAPQYTPHTAVAPAETDGDIVIPLRRSGRFVGTVHGPDGDPVDGARVFAVESGLAELLHMPEGSIESGKGELRALRATTDAAGRFEITDVRADRAYFLLADAPGQARSSTLSGLRSAANAGATEHRLDLRRPARLALRVSGPDGEVPGGLLVWIERGSFPPRVAAREGDEYVFSGLDPGSHRVRLRAAGYVSGEVDVALEPGDDRTVEADIDLGAHLAGVVVDDRGETVDGAVLEFVAKSGDAGAGEGADATTQSDASGSFRIAGLSGTSYEIRVRREGYDAIEFLSVAAPQDDLRVVLARGARVTAELAVPNDADLPDDVVAWIRSARTGAVTAFVPRTRGSRIEIDGVPTGPCGMYIAVTGYAPQFVEIDAKPGERLDLGALALGQGQEISGVVRGPDGGGVAAAEITVANSWMPPGPPLTSDAAGAFVARHLATTDVVVVVRADGHVPTQRSPGTERGALEITLRRGAVISGRVLRADGSRHADTQVFVVSRSDSADAYEATTDLLGRFRLRVPEGAYHVWFRADARTRGRQEIDVTEGETRVVDLRAE